MQPTTFQKKVYEACSRIPAGKVTTYGRLAKEGVDFDNPDKVAIACLWDF
jgi:O6-methylguanine-DNA--protein-cysteine methyltransferase